MHLRDAISFYHDLLDPTTAQDTAAELEEQQRRRGLQFGDRAICTVLRPRFLTEAQYAFLQAQMRRLMLVFEKAFCIARDDAHFRAQFHLPEWEEALVMLPLPFPTASPTSRMDTFYLPATQVLRCTEYNAETPAGIGYSDALSEIMLTLPAMRCFEQRYDVRPLPAMHHVLNILMSCYRAWGGQEHPRICILDWREVPTYSEFVVFEEYFRRQGYDCLIADPRECDYRAGTLYARGRRVQIIYKRVLISELVQHGGLGQPVLRAVRDNAVCMVNPPQCKLLHRKTSLAVLSDEANAARFTADELATIHDLIPWTRYVEERFTQHNGRRVDLVPFITEHKDQLVLKPADEYGGKGVVLGWTVSQTEWERALTEALHTPTVVQERVEVPQEEFPSFANGALHFIPRLMDTNPYLWHGSYASGCLTRLSTAALLNVTAGGGSTVPTMLIQAR